MFVDAFTVQYLQNLRDSRKKPLYSGRARFTPLVTIFAGILLLICSLVLVAIQSGKLNKIPHVQMPHVPKIPKISIPELKIPDIKLPEFKLSLQDSSRANPIVAGHYKIKKLYSTELVKCADGQTVTLWQDSSHDGSTVFGSVHGKHIVGSLRPDGMWQRGKKLFSLAKYNTNQRGVVQIDPLTGMVEKINPGDGCLFVSQCAHISGTWKRDESVACEGKTKQIVIHQDACTAMIGETKLHVKENVVFRMVGKTEKQYGRVRSRVGALRFHDHKGCVFSKSLVASEEGH